MQKEGVDFFETYAPVVNWNTVRLILILVARLGLKTKQVDFIAAFVQADIDLPPTWDQMTPEERDRAGVYVEMPRGFLKEGKVLKLNKSLYGLKQSPRNYYLHYKQKMEEAGFEAATDVDPCLFLSKKVICISYVDDCIFVSQDEQYVSESVQALRDLGLNLEEEDTVAGFLGVHIERTKHSVILTQKGLINKVIEAVGASDLPAVDTPATTTLGKDEDGEPCHATFSYSSVIGMLWYLYGHSRPDLGFSLSQLSRFTFCPKRSHELALIRIGQYLKGTRDKGLIMSPLANVSELSMDAYVDSDFLGLYGSERRDDPDNVRSRAGHVICINGVPIIWSSKLMDGIGLSSMHVEYQASVEPGNA